MVSYTIFIYKYLCIFLEACSEYNSRFLGGEIGRHTWVPGLRSRWRLTDLTVDREDDPMAMDMLPPGPPKPTAPDDVREEDAIQLDYMPFKDSYTEVIKMFKVVD